jgi:hypothetical protein
VVADPDTGEVIEAEADDLTPALEASLRERGIEPPVDTEAPESPVEAPVARSTVRGRPSLRNAPLEPPEEPWERQVREAPEEAPTPNNPPEPVPVAEVVPQAAKDVANGTTTRTRKPMDKRVYAAAASRSQDPLALVSKIARREVTNTKDLSPEEADYVLAELDKLPKS